MTGLSYKYKIIISAICFLLFAAGMFLYGYKILDNKNQLLSDAALERQTEFELLEVELTSFEQGQKDLATLSTKAVPPSDLFSKDTKVVKEIKRLEEIAAENEINFTLSISGSAKSAKKATGTTSEVFAVPYTATLEGSFFSLMKYMQETENLPFVTHTKMFNIISTKDNKVKATLSSEFYIKK